MIPFEVRCPECAARERLALRIQEPGLPLPPGRYEFFECFCEDADCDCRRTLLRVFSPQHPGRVLATINYGWESTGFYTRWMHGDEEAGRDITSASLDPLNPQSELAEALLDGFRDYVNRDSFYPEQLRRHYQLFKNQPAIPGAPAGSGASPPPPPLTITEILEQLRHVPNHADFTPYRAALEAAIARREEIVPELIAALDRFIADPAHYRRNQADCLHLFALYLLAQFREPRALNAFLRFFSLPGEDALDLTGDMVTEKGAAILASVCGGDPAPLLRLAQDESVNEFVRAQAIDGLLVQAGWGERPREAVITDLRRLFETMPKPGNGYLWAALVCAVCDFNAPELAPEARQSFAEGLVDEGVIGPEDMEGSLAGTWPYEAGNSQERFQAFLERNAPIDAVSECSGWLCFRDEEAEAEYWKDADVDTADAPDDAFLPPIDLPRYAPPKPYVAPPKVGRNDPCPCGSGKKYKKCCAR